MTDKIDSDILTIEEAAAYLRMHPQTLREKVAAGKIPGKKPAKRWLFSKRRLQEWIGAENREENKPNNNEGGKNKWR